MNSGRRKSTSRRIKVAALCGSLLVNVLAIGTFTNVSGGGSITVRAQEAVGFKCRNATLKGRYAIRGDGVVPGGPPPAPMIPFAIVSLMTLDGSGALTNDVTVSRNGVIFRNVDPGAYNISEDCTGNMSINIAEPPFLLTFDLVVTDKGNEFYAIATTPSVVTFGGKRLH